MAGAPRCLAIVLSLGLWTIVTAKNVQERPLGIGPTFGYVPVRKGANMFWWLESCQGCRGQAVDEEPLIIWLQGGPGASGVGYGNFEEIGPYGIGWERREHTWANEANLLFLDNPVGTGFSYVGEGANFTRNNAEIAADLLSFLTDWVHGHPEFEVAPMFIASESYGGKMAISFARAIQEARQAGDIDVNLKGVMLGDSWISPIDFVEAWGPYLQAFSLLDDSALGRLNSLANKTHAAMGSTNDTLATELWGQVEALAENLTDNVNFYNALEHNEHIEPAANGPSAQYISKLVSEVGLTTSAASLLARQHRDPLTEWMDRDLRRWMGDTIPDHVEFGAQAGQVFRHLAGDFMRDVTADVDAVLATGLPVTIYQGQLDLICCTLGVDAWLRRLKWPGMQGFERARSRPVHWDHDEQATSGFVKRHANLAMYVLLEAGHMVPADQPRRALHMLRHIMRDASAGPNAGGSQASIS